MIETKHADVHGLNCPNCANKVERAVAGLSGVSSVDVEFDTEQAVFEYDSSTVSLERIAYTVAQTGCDSRRFTISLDGRRIDPAEPQVASTDGDGASGDCCDDENDHTGGHQRNQPPF